MEKLYEYEGETGIHGSQDRAAEHQDGSCGGAVRSGVLFSGPQSGFCLHRCDFRHEQSRLHGGNRFFGTLVGGFIGMGLFAIYMELFPNGSNRWFLVPLTFIGVVILILLCQHIWVGGVQPGGVVLCILLFNTPTDTYITYALNRILDTGIGVLAAIFVNGMLPGGFTFGFMHRFYERVGIRDDVVDEFRAKTVV